MKKSKNLLKNGTDKSYKLNCSLFNFDYTKLLKMIDLLCGKKTKREEIHANHYILNNSQ